MGTKNPTNIYNNVANGKVVDVSFSMRRNSRQPLDESSLVVSYSKLKDEMKSESSSIYKGQIVVTQGEEGTQSVYFTPFLIKNESQNKASYYADRLMTQSYTTKVLDEEYVKKVQLGTTYTGVGKWYGATEIYGTSSYNEIFNDYNTNKVELNPSDNVEPIFAHVEGSNNVTRGKVSHVEGSRNQNNGAFSHIEGTYNYNSNGSSSHIEGTYNASYSNNSHVEGRNNISRGEFSHVGGGWSEASNIGTFANGYMVIVNSPYASGFGSHNNIMGEASFGEGAYNASYQDYSHVEGFKNYNKGKSSHVEGGNNATYSSYSHVEGYSSYVYGDGGHAEGMSKVGSPNANASYAHAENYSSALGVGSHSEGTSQAKGSYSHAEGYQTIATGTSSHTEGYKTEANNYSHAEGYLAKASGDYSHAEGSNSKASGPYSHVEGKDTNANGDYSHVEGNNSSTSNTAISSHVEGNGNIANAKYSHVEGDHTSTSEEAESSHVEGYYAKGEAKYVHVEGSFTKASANSAHAEGNNSYAMAEYSHVEGLNNIANGEGSHIEGKDNQSTNTGVTSHVEGASNIASGQSSHAEGYKSKSSGDYSHVEGRENESRGLLSHAEGYDTHANGQYSHSSGKSTIANGDYSFTGGQSTQSNGNSSFTVGSFNITHGNYGFTSGFQNVTRNDYEYGSGTYNRSYLSSNNYIVENLNGTNSKVPNEFARLGNRYIPGRYPSSINSNNAINNIDYYDDSYSSIFTIGNGNSGAITSSSLIDKDGNLMDAGSNVKKAGRHNVMDIRKNGQMYYDGGMIVGGETVAPVSYSYVASLGPTAYLTTVMRALLIQPEYYRPSLQYALWYTGSSTHNAVSSSNSVGWAYFQNGVTSDGICEVGASSNFQLRFRAFNVGVDKPHNIDPIYGTSLGNMLGYSTGVTNITYQILNNSTNLSAQSFVTKYDTELLAGMNGTLNSSYGPKKVDAKNNDYGGFGPFDAFKEEYSKTGKHAPLAYYSSYCNAVDNKGAFGESCNNGNYSSGLYSTQQTVASSIKFDREGQYIIWKATSYTFNPATQMYFQQLAEKGTYIPDNGVAPLDKFKQTTVNSSALFIMKVRYRIYYGVTNDVPSDSWKSWTQNDFLTRGQVAHGHAFGTMNAGSGTTQSVTQAFSSTVKTAWFAFPEDIYKLTRYSHAAVPSNRYMYFKNAMNAESSLDTGRITDAVSSARPMYEYVTTNGINPSGLKYHIVAVSAPAGITKGTWGFTFQRK